MDNEHEPKPYAKVLDNLVIGTVYYEDKDSWKQLTDYREKVITHFSDMGIDVVISKDDGFAFLDQRYPDSDEKDPLPRIIQSKRMTYFATLLCVMLRERLIQFEKSGHPGTKLVLSNKEILDLISLFLKEKTDQKKSIDKIESAIKMLTEAGLLKKLDKNGERLEVMRILKAKIPAEKIEEIKRKLLEYISLLESGNGTAVAE